MRKISEIIQSELSFFPELGFGYFPVPKNRPYDERYFEKYKAMADTEMGRQLTDFRVNFVRKHHQGDVCDVGIGCGQFVEAYNCSGFDVNQAGIDWLKAEGRYLDFYKHGCDALTFWDVLEHIDEPDKAIACANKWVFVSIPVFDSAEHILRSRHFRKDEHIFYFTNDGLIRWFGENGFVLVESVNTESEIGRDGITTYAFRRE
ncbi:methyltransferase domain-containing protein [Klebsiella quasipneumoniae]|uniref:methyltransferase domain-containing protein n=1 Tax=Klebsiella quasipneumoniae TaxID=1463165 RepID=UPI0024071548|nr:methyltransferase domain-containing protein [Klebsiella quasipneumoniae]MDG0556620.1 class I SAM-dependent methyltransferase [Klebsiella quasipneumoniae]